MKNRNKYQPLSEEEMKGLPSKYDLEREIASKDDKKKLYDAIEMLKPEYKQVIYLVFFEGFSNSETAEIFQTQRVKRRYLKVHPAIRDSIPGLFRQEKQGIQRIIPSHFR